MSDPRETDQDSLRAAAEEALTHGYSLPEGELALVKELAWRRALQLDDMEKQRDDLRELLRTEYLRHTHLELPWKCVEADCPRFGKSLYLTGCNCRLEVERKHVAAVRKELRL